MTDESEKPEKKKFGCFKVGCLGLVACFVGLFILGTIIDNSKKRAAQEEQDRLQQAAAEQAKVITEEAISRARELQGDGKIKEAMAVIDEAEEQVDGDNASHLQAFRTGLERAYGPQVEPEVAQMLSEAKAAFAAGDIEGGRAGLSKILVPEYRFTNAYEDAKSFSDRLRSVTTGKHYNQMVVQMTDEEFAAFDKDGTLPERPFDSDPGLDKAIRFGLLKTKEHAKRWRDEHERHLQEIAERKQQMAQEIAERQFLHNVATITAKKENWPVLRVTKNLEEGKLVLGYPGAVVVSKKSSAEFTLLIAETDDGWIEMNGSSTYLGGKKGRPVTVFIFNHDPSKLRWKDGKEVYFDTLPFIMESKSPTTGKPVYFCGHRKTPTK